MSKMPIEKPAKEELARMYPHPVQIEQKLSDPVNIIRYVIPYPPDRYHNRVIEAHFPRSETESVTWWECFGEDK
jgi:hypothetical protein